MAAISSRFTTTFNEQITNPDSSITANAGHEVLLGPTAVGDLFFGHSVCGVTIPAPPTTTTTIAPTTTPTIAPTTTTVAADTTGAHLRGDGRPPPGSVGHAEQDVIVQDTGSGLQSMTNIVITNGTRSVAPFTVGTTSPVVVTATKSNTGQRTVWSFDATDVAGNTVHCA